MKTSFINIILKSTTAALMLLAVSFNASASDSEAPKDVIVSGLSTAGASPIIVTAADLVTKVYGALEPTATMEETMAYAGAKLKMMPEKEDENLWLDSDKGYVVSYSGMTPEVSAVAQFDDDSLSSFGYFFIFPYNATNRDEANRHQCSFCSSLLQEMYDMGSIVGMPVMENANTSADEADEADDSLFDVLASYEGNNINMSLKEESLDNATGRFLLIVEVTPANPNPYDSVMAQR